VAVKILEIHHHSLRVGSGERALDQALTFYKGVLGLNIDSGRPLIPDAPGVWLDVAEVGQIHLIALSGESALAPEAGKDPTAPHIAFGVANIQEARAELDKLGVQYWAMNVMAKTAERSQIFLNDPNGNLLELHQIGTCRCMPAARASRNS
jgi:catechol 2,3-dioxygenase-like lactoylglutathione lyase family enzyme